MRHDTFAKHTARARASLAYLMAPSAQPNAADLDVAREARDDLRAAIDTIDREHVIPFPPGFAEAIALPSCLMCAIDMHARRKAGPIEPFPVVFPIPFNTAADAA